MIKERTEGVKAADFAQRLWPEHRLPVLPSPAQETSMKRAVSEARNQSKERRSNDRARDFSIFKEQNIHREWALIVIDVLFN